MTAGLVCGVSVSAETVTCLFIYCRSKVFVWADNTTKEINQTGSVDCGMINTVVAQPDIQVCTGRLSKRLVLDCVLCCVRLAGVAIGIGAVIGVLIALVIVAVIGCRRYVLQLQFFFDNFSISDSCRCFK